MKSFSAYLSCGFLGLALLAGVGCDSKPSPEVLEPYEALYQERIAQREEIIKILDSIVDEASANRAIRPVLNLKAGMKGYWDKRKTLGDPTPKGVNRYFHKKYGDYEKDLKRRGDAAAKRAATVPGSARFFKEVPFFIFKFN